MGESWGLPRLLPNLLKQVFRGTSTSVSHLILHETLVLMGGEELGRVGGLHRILSHLLKQVFRCKCKSVTRLIFHETLVFIGGEELGEGWGTSPNSFPPGETSWGFHKCPPHDFPRNTCFDREEELGESWETSPNSSPPTKTIVSLSIHKCHSLDFREHLFG